MVHEINAILYRRRSQAWQFGREQSFHIYTNKTYNDRFSRRKYPNEAQILIAHRSRHGIIIIGTHPGYGSIKSICQEYMEFIHLPILEFRITVLHENVIHKKIHGIV